MRNALFASLALFLAGCASTEFTPWVGEAVTQGTGGTRRTVNGIDIWENGTPPVRYRILGIIDDSRDDAPFFDAYKDVTAKAREVGGDAVILVTAERFRTGATITPSTTTVERSGNTLYATSTPGFVSDSFQKDSKWQVVKYLR